LLLEQRRRPACVPCVHLCVVSSEHSLEQQCSKPIITPSLCTSAVSCRCSFSLVHLNPGASIPLAFPRSAARAGSTAGGRCRASRGASARRPRVRDSARSGVECCPPECVRRVDVDRRLPCVIAAVWVGRGRSRSTRATSRDGAIFRRLSSPRVNVRVRR
jgi:hypothetical protein